MSDIPGKITQMLSFVDECLWIWSACHGDETSMMSSLPLSVNCGEAGGGVSIVVLQLLVDYC